MKHCILKPVILHSVTGFICASTIIVSMLFSIVSHASENQFIAWQNPQYILKAFNEIALKNEYKTTNERILKWQRPIRYQFHYEKLKKLHLVETLLTTHLNHLAEITKHSISVSNNQPANLNIYLTNDKNYASVIKKYSGSKVRNLQRESNCMGTYRTNSANEILSATIVIPVDHVYSRGLLVACIVEETTQVMGLPNDSDWVNPSIANDASKVELLTGLDYILLKLLYNPEIKAGMTKASSTKILKRNIQRLFESGAIQQANRKVNQSGLYPLITAP